MLGVGWKPDFIIDGKLDTGWASEGGKMSGEYVIVALPGGQTYPIHRVRINPYNTPPSCCPDDSTKDFEIRVSTTDANPASFRSVFRGSTPKENAFFEFTFAASQAKYVMLFVVNNHGGPWTEVKEFEVYQSCDNPGGGAGGGGGGGTTPPTATPVTGGGGGGGGGGACDGVPASQNMNIAPSNCAKAGTTFSFEGYGFNANEKVGVYATGPDGSVIGAPFQVTADANGVTSGTNGVRLETATNSPQGVWALTMEGVNSHKKAIGYIKLIAP
jgi:hypothetical protein